MVKLTPEWTRPTTILFAAECPANEKAFTFALAQAKESGANLVILHICDPTSRLPYQTDTAQAVPGAWKDLFEPMLQHARDLGIQCRMEVREGIATEEILRFLKERRVDRVVMGVHTPGPIGKLLVGSVAETILRKSSVPVTIVGPYARSGTYRDFLTRTILCNVSSHPSSGTVVQFAAELALRHSAQLVLHYAIPPQEVEKVLVSQALDQMEQDMLDLIPARVRVRLNLRASVVLGDPTEELLYLGRVMRANLIVVGAHNATHFAAISNSGVVYKALAYAACPVLTLSPILLAEYGPRAATYGPSQINYLPGVV